MRVNLGAGNNILRKFANHDLTKHRPEIDVVHDLNVLPWPWEDGSLDEVRSWAVFEHLKLTLAESIEECWRMLKVGGLLVAKVPDVNANTVAHDPTHIWRGWPKEAFDFFDPTTGTYGERGKMYGFHPWQIQSIAATAKGKAWVARMKKLA